MSRLSPIAFELASSTKSSGKNNTIKFFGERNEIKKSNTIKLPIMNPHKRSYDNIRDLKS